MGNVLPVQMELKFLSEFFSMADGGRSERLMAEKSPICLQSSETLSSYHHLSDEHWEVYGGIFLNKLYHYFVSGNMFAKAGTPLSFFLSSSSDRLQHIFGCFERKLLMSLEELLSTSAKLR